MDSDGKRKRKLLWETIHIIILLWYKNILYPPIETFTYKPTE